MAICYVWPWTVTYQKFLLCVSSQGQELYSHEKWNMYIYWFSSESSYRRRWRRRRQQRRTPQYDHYTLLWDYAYLQQQQHYSYIFLLRYATNKTLLCANMMSSAKLEAHDASQSARRGGLSDRRKEHVQKSGELCTCVAWDMHAAQIHTYMLTTILHSSSEVE